TACACAIPPSASSAKPSAPISASRSPRCAAERPPPSHLLQQLLDLAVAGLQLRHVPGDGGLARLDLAQRLRHRFAEPFVDLVARRELQRPPCTDSLPDHNDRD